MIFLILVSCKNRAISASYPQQKLHSPSRFPSLFLNSLGSFSILFLRDKLGEWWFASTPPQLEWMTEQKNTFEVCKHAARYNEFGYKFYNCKSSIGCWLYSRWCSEHQIGLSTSSLLGVRATRRWVSGEDVPFFPHLAPWVACSQAGITHILW